MNPNVEETVKRLLPGVLPTDEVSYAGYPEQSLQAAEWRIVRDGRVVATLHLSKIVEGDRRLIGPVYACRDSRIGDPEAPTVGHLATPFTLPGYERCDPYAIACEALWMEVDEYESRTGEDLTPLIPLGPWASELCLDDFTTTACGERPPGSMALTILLSPSDFEAVLLAEGCGSAPSEACG